MNTHYVLGAPIFGNSPKLRLEAPVGQLKLHEKVRQETKDPTHVFRALAMEYVSIIAGLTKMGIKYKIVLPKDKKFIDRTMLAAIEEFKIATIEFPTTKDLSALSYPRDLATVLPDNRILIDSALETEHWTNQVITKASLSPYGQGGRILVSPRTAVVTAGWFWKQDPRFEEEPRISHLTASNLRVGVLPNPALVEIKGSITAYGSDDHIDRTVGQIVDKQGKVHFVIDPYFYSGYTQPSRSRPVYDSTKSLRKVQEVCRQLDAELHIPKKILIPLSVNFLQFDSGQVLMTGGDKNVTGVIADILGKDEVFTTDTPIRYFPAWSKAGIRCLIGEWPDFCISSETFETP